MKRLFAIFCLTLAISSRPVSTVLAVEVPNFPSCLNPNGAVIANYDSGTHGIVGSGATYTGKDTVYNVGEGLVTQCFCSTDGNGIQTDWWNASSLTEDEVNVLKSQGWNYIPNGNLWGLSSDAFITKNTTYSCLPTGGGDPNGGGDGLSDGKSDGRSSCPECTAPPIGGQVLGTSTGDVLGLAATGDSWILYSVFATAFVLLLAGAKKLRKS